MAQNKSISITHTEILARAAQNQDLGGRGVW